jgi:hypothetical protein
VSANHDASAKVGIVKYWNGLKPDIIIADLLTNFTPTNPAYLPTADWASEVGDWLPGVTYTAVITEPTGVNKLMQELLQQSTCFSWWDERVSQIKLKAIRPPRTEEVTTLTDDNFLRGSVSVTQSTDERLSRVVVYYGKKNPTIKDDEVTNYAGIYVFADADAESATEYGDVRVKTVLSRWIPDVAGATLLANRTLARFRNPTIKVRFALDAKDGALWAGDIANVTTRYIQDFSGGAVTSYAQVTEASEKESGTRFEYEASLSFFTGRYAYITPDSQPDYLAATEAQRLRYGFICTDAGLMSNGDAPYKVI